MPWITKHNARELALKANAAKLAYKRQREGALPTPTELETAAHEHNTRLWGLIVAIDKRAASEIVKPKPDGQLLRDLAAARRTFLAQTHGNEPEVMKANGAPVLSDPTPAPPAQE